MRAFLLHFSISLEGGLGGLPLRASNENWFIWSISSIWFVWLVGLEIHPEEPDRQASARCTSTGDQHAYIFTSLHPPHRGAARLSFTARIGRLSSFQMILPGSLASLSWNGTRIGLTAAVERAHSDRARSGSKGSARVSFHPFHRARSASKKDGLAAPLRLFQARYILRHPWTGQVECAAATAYRQQLRERYEREAQTLANLTGWNIGEIRKTMNIETASAPLDKKWYQRLWGN